MTGIPKKKKIAMKMKKGQLQSRPQVGAHWRAAAGLSSKPDGQAP
jgi:hypothetical protein